MELGFWGTIGVSILTAGMTTSVAIFLFSKFKTPKRVEIMEPSSQS